jgi:putative salt-induced outer membrane protein
MAFAAWMVLSIDVHAAERIRARTLKLSPKPAQNSVLIEENTTPKGAETPENSAGTPGPSTLPSLNSTPPAPDLPPSKFTGSAELAIAVTTGNTTTRNINTALDLSQQWGHWSLDFKGRYFGNSNDSNMTAEQTSLELKGLRSLTPRSDLFTDLYFLNNRFSGIEYQVTPDFGFGYEWIFSDPLQLRTETALGATAEKNTKGQTESYPIARFGFLFAWKLNERSDFSHETIAFTSLAESKSWRLRSETSLATDLTSILAMKISYRYEFNNSPPEGKLKEDSVTSTALVLRF